MKNIFRYLIYYLVMAASYLLFAFFLKLGVKLATATFIAITSGIFLTYASEYILPFKKEWLGFDDEAKTDGLYFVFIHTFFGNVIVALTTSLFIWVIAKIQIITGKSTWLNRNTIIVQVILLIFISDFGRYWLHRFFHESPSLWKFHAVHHSVKKLYWWNVGRFHPIDKLTVLCFESLLFLYLGATPYLIALYYIFYSVNGFLQHSNIDIRLGLFNKLISGPEQHRYHHSDIPKEANNNYGNKVSVFDILFGTYYLPDLNGPSQYGLKQTNYPKSFIGQLLEPFKKNS